MKFLLDENLPHSLRGHLSNHLTSTAAYAGFAGLVNGRLLDAAERAGFEVLVTGDKTLQYEQNLGARKIALVSLSAISWPVIAPHVLKIARAVDNAQPGSFVRVNCGAFAKPRRHPDKGLTHG